MRALRGATTITADTEAEVLAATTEMLQALFDRNELSSDDVISVLFTATPDIASVAPAVAARSLGLVDVPLICTQEMAVDGGLNLCIRLLMHIESDQPRSELRHVFLNGAKALRPDLADQ